MNLYSEDIDVDDDWDETDYCPACREELTIHGDCPDCDNGSYDE